MKKIVLFGLLLFSFSPLFSQTKTISTTSLGGGLTFAAVMDQPASTIIITLEGPADRYLACGIGLSMSDADPFIYTTGKTGVNDPIAVYDYKLTSTSASSVTKDVVQNWTTIANTVTGATRTIVVSRLLNSGDATDKIINFSDASINVIWARASTASMVLAYHGNNRGSTALTWSTPDAIAPALVASPFSPADNATSVAVATNLSATFNENIVVGTGLIELRLLTGGTLVESFDVSTAAVSISGAVLTINPTINLSSFSDYYVTIPGGAIEDAAGNSFAGFTDNTTWNFTTVNLTNSIDETDNSFIAKIDQNQVLNIQNVTGASYDVNIYSLSGQLLISKVKQNEDINIELSNIENAVIMLQITSSKGTMIKKINIR